MDRVRAVLIKRCQIVLELFGSMLRESLVSYIEAKRNLHGMKS